MTEAAARDRWTATLAAVADRVRRERGVDDPWSTTVEYGSLWAVYGDLRVRVGIDGDVRDEAELFEEVDGWVAHDRRSGPGRVLDRDRAARAAWREGLPNLRAFWLPLVERVLADVLRTTDVDLPWSVELEGQEFVFPQDPGLWFAEHGAVMPTREAEFPQWTLRLPHQWFQLPALDDVDDAVLHLADHVQDYVVEELPGAWPVCPGHPHPMQPAATGAGPVWECPTGAGAAYGIGSLPASG